MKSNCRLKAESPEKTKNKSLNRNSYMGVARLPIDMVFMRKRSILFVFAPKIVQEKKNGEFQQEQQVQ